MWALGFINRWCLLLGMPLLRRIPIVRDLPLVRGYFRIRTIDLPHADRQRLAMAVNPGTVAFIGPNHPEFGLDWMIDKELSTYVAPRVANWASHGIVATAPWFWLRNNLISHNGGTAATDFSVSWALRGEAVLLHPEGSVHWTGDMIHPLFTGIADMGTEAARRLAAGDPRSVFIVPIVWKFRFVGDVTQALHREMHFIEQHLGLGAGRHVNVAERFRALQEGILRKQMRRFDFDTRSVRGLDHFARQDAFRDWLMRQLLSRHAVAAGDSAERTITRLQRAIGSALRQCERTPSGDTAGRRALLELDRDRAEEANRLGGFCREVYATPTLTQEQMAECLKRHRATLVKRGVRNTIHNFLPTPFGPRIADVRVPAPVQVDPARAASADREEQRAYVIELIATARERMQQALDDINNEARTETDQYAHVNPFAVRIARRPATLTNLAAATIAPLERQMMHT